MSRSNRNGASSAMRFKARLINSRVRAMPSGDPGLEHSQQRPRPGREYQSSACALQEDPPREPHGNRLRVSRGGRRVGRVVFNT